MKQRYSLAALSLALLLLGAGITGCTKSEEQQQGATGAAKSTAKETASGITEELSQTVLAQVPTDADGFILWDGMHPAYTKLINSPWGQGSDVGAVLQSANTEVQEAIELLRAMGLNPDDKEAWRKLFGQAALFVRAEGAAEPVLGVVFRPNGVNLQEKLPAMRAELAKDPKNAVEDFEVAGQKGFSVVANEAPGAAAEGATGEAKPSRAFFVATADTGIIANDKAVVEEVIAKKTKDLPTIVSSKQFADAVSGFPQKSSRFAFGYFNAAEILAAESVAEQPLPKDQGLQAVSLALSMDQAPQTDIRLVYDPAKVQESWLSGLATSGSTTILGAVPNKPLLFLSFDGTTLKSLKQSFGVLAAQGQPDMLNNLAFMDNVKRFGVAARLAPPGQSLLPIPDLLFVFETPQAEQAVPQLQKLVLAGMQQSGAGMGTDWTEKEVNGTKVKSLMSGVGVGVFMASVGDLVLLTSNEQQLNEIVGGKDKGQFEKNLTGRVETVIAQQPSLGNVYVNFEEMGQLLENMGQLLVMFAPQNQNTAQYLEPEKIQALKKMGTMVGSVTVKDGVVGIQTFYQS